MKNLKKLAYFAIVLLLLVSCEKETSVELDDQIINEPSVELENQLINEPYSSFEEKLQLMKSNSSKQTYVQRTEEFNLNYSGICGTMNSLELDPQQGYLRAELWDFYDFYGEAGQQVSIWVDRTSNWDPMMSLFFGVTDNLDGVTYYGDSANLEHIYSWDDQVGDEYDCFREPQIINYSLPYTGEYTLAVYVLNNCGANPPTYNLVTNINSGCNDEDNDTIYDEIDNCPLTYNPNQADWDYDGMGDVCDDDDDNDGIIDENDKHPFSNLNRFVEVNCELRIANQHIKKGTFMNDEIDDVINLINAMEDVSDSRRTNRFRSKMYFIINNWKYKYRLIDNTEKRQLLNCVNQMSYPFNDPS